ncbi:MAG: hypothetical protein FJ130_11685 [Deltaproteobacteria bacterium]|nr:hypothetical protein [Deltaproteobacteria bacterium]
MKKIFLYIFLLLLTWGSLSEGATSLQSLVPQRNLPEGWSLVDGPKTYTKKTLFERINGQAGLFFKYGFQKSVFAIYQNQKDKENQIEMDIYDMGSVLHAFGIFSRFRNGERGGGVGLESFIEGQSGIFYQEKYFIMLYGTEPNPDLLKRWSLLISKTIPNSLPPPREIGFFPREGLNPGSVQYFPDGLLGRKFLGRGFQGTYQGKDGTQEPKLFVAIFKNSQEAANALKQYRDDLTKNGKIHQFESNTLWGHEDHRREVHLVRKEAYLLGAIGFGKEGTRARMDELIKNVK